MTTPDLYMPAQETISAVTIAPDNVYTSRSNSPMTPPKPLLAYIPSYWMKTFLFLLCSTLLLSEAFCQDIITRTDSARIEATIQSVGNDLIRYRLYASPDSSEYRISTLDVLFVEFADGTRRVFSQQAIRIQPASGADYHTDFGRNILSVSISDFLFVNTTFAYERISRSGKVGVKIPLSFGLDPREEFNDFYRRNKNFSVGLDLHIYPFGQGRFSYYLGPQVEYSSFNYYDYYYDRNDPNAQTQFRSNTGNMFTFIASNGVYYQFSKSFVTAFDVGVGVRTWSGLESNEYTYYYINRVFIPFNLQIGYRF
jgi:hypothetical protein